MKKIQQTSTLQFFSCAVLTIAFVAAAQLAVAATSVTASSVAAASPILTDQGSKWTEATRTQFYTQDQGSQLIPLAWAMALKQENGSAFMADSLQRYGYLPNPQSPEPGLAVGFTTNSFSGSKMLGMTCSACHTRQIDVGDKSYRIDGGPAISDFQDFMWDLDVAVNTVLTDPKAFADFAKSVLGAAATTTDKAKLRAELAAWFLPYNAIVKGSFSAQSPWGPARLDAIAMIFNRVSGLDIGTGPDRIIKENIKLADAPVRYPFLWNAAVQDFTQWPGFSPNGNRIFGLTRNLGEVFGVFAHFAPVKDSNDILKISYTKNNSANFKGLNTLENLIMKLGPPVWPWALDKTLANKGEAVFNKKDVAQGNSSCADCHGIKKGQFRSLAAESWATPIMDVGTDSREAKLLNSTVKTGVLEGAIPYPGGTPLKAVDTASSVLGTVVIGSILQHYLAGKVDGVEHAVLTEAERLEAKFKVGIERVETEIEGDLHLKGHIGTLDDLKQSLIKHDTPITAFKYESRVLQGIWAAAPYLHNGSVPTLAELLKPDTQRVASFKVGTEYDVKTVGLNTQQSKFNFTFNTTDCSKRDSGNSRCGHNFGTGFTAEEKLALLEYLKML
jgi:hypothetical protein